jgi:hypothetical protein
MVGRSAAHLAEAPTLQREHHHELIRGGELRKAVDALERIGSRPRKNSTHNCERVRDVLRTEDVPEEDRTLLGGGLAGQSLVEHDPGRVDDTQAALELDVLQRGRVTCR